MSVSNCESQPHLAYSYSQHELINHSITSSVYGTHPLPTHSYDSITKGCLFGVSSGRTQIVSCCNRSKYTYVRLTYTIIALIALLVRKEEYKAVIWFLVNSRAKRGRVYSAMFSSGERGALENGSDGNMWHCCWYCWNTLTFSNGNAVLVLIAIPCNIHTSSYNHYHNFAKYCTRLLIAIPLISNLNESLAETISFSNWHPNSNDLI